MAKLVISLNGMTVREFPLVKERVTIGRNSSNDIMLNEPIVSGEHAAIQLRTKPTITDLNSTNGTKVNGSAISKLEIKHNDVIRIGSHELRFVDEDVQDYAATMIMFGEAEEKKEGSGKASLMITNGPRAGEVMPIEKRRTALGKPGLQVAVIIQTAEGYELMHVALGNEAPDTWLNGKPLKDARHPLKDGDKIAIADARLVFMLD